jgi:hypothetical protein
LDFGNPSQITDRRQYVNLDREYVEYPDKCVPQLEPLDHGPLIYMEASVSPPLPGIIVRFEYEDPPFNREENESPTNQKIEGSGKYTASSNPDLQEVENDILWGSHTPFDHNYSNPDISEDDGRTLGDNYYFFYDLQCCNNKTDFRNYCIAHHVTPEKYLNRLVALYAPQKRPCFANPDCVEGGDLEACLDDYCSPGELSPKTNKKGKFETYFNTMSHGGDNFSFKASGYFYSKKKPCIQTISNKIFTVWREITVDYAYMEMKDTYIPCYFLTVPPKRIKDYVGQYTISDWLPYVQGVFDDGFMEIKPGRQFGDTEYKTKITDYYGYPVPENRISFQPAPKDTILLLGVDHVQNVCMNNILGRMVLTTREDKFYYSYVAVGNIGDILKNGGYEEVDKIPYQDEKYLNFICKREAAHEIMHSLYGEIGLGCGPAFDNGKPGLMSYKDKRQYLCYEHIIQCIRDNNVIFDQAEY